MECAIGIDVGTTNSKVVLCELPSCDVVHLEKFKSPKIEDGTFVDFDVNGLIGELERSLRVCASAAAAAAAPVRFISIASVGESGVLVYPDGTHDASSIAWFDTRGEEYAAAMHEDGFAAKAYGITGIPAHANYGLFKLLWMRDHGSRLNGVTWLPLGDFVAWWLCGERLQDESLASRTFALNLVSGGVATAVLDRYGLSGDLFPELKESGVFRAPIRSNIAEVTGLSADCQVCVAGHDHMAGSIACGLNPKRELLNSTGTSEGILTLNEQPVLTEESFQNRLSNGRYVTDGLFSYYASLPTAGFALEWVSKLMGIDEDTFFDIMPIDMHKRYLKREFDGRELIFIPHLRGSGPPKRSVRARGCLYGMKDSSTRDDVFFSADLGLVFELRNLYLHMIGEGGREVAKVIGPSIKSPLWMQLKADILGIQVQACRVRESVARGAVMLAARKAGWDVKPVFECTVYESDAERHAYYDDLFKAAFLPLSDALAAFEGR